MRIAEGNPNPAARFLPAEGVFFDAEAGTYAMRPCRVFGWNVETNELLVRWGSVSPSYQANGAAVAEGEKGAQEEEPAVPIHRIFVRLLAEDPIVYVQRLVNAHYQREKAMAWILYYLSCDAMPTTDLPDLTDGLRERLLRLGTGIPQLSEAVFPGVEQHAEQLIQEILLEWKRSHNRVMLQDLMKRNHSVMRMVERSTRMNLTELVNGPNVSVALSELGDPAKIVDVGFDFKRRERSFIFSTYFTQPEVVTALTGVRRECMKVLEQSLFDLPTERQMPLEVFQKRQMARINHVANYLKHEWLDSVGRVIKESFQTASKGWLNLKESKQGIYEMSKLKKLFTTVRLMMEDTLFDFVYSSLQSFITFFEEVSDFTVFVVNMNCVKNTWPGSDADDCIEKQPLFTINLIEKDGRFAYDISARDFERHVINLFDQAILCTEAVPQVERYVMTQYFWRNDSEGPFLDSVKLEDERVQWMRERVRRSIQSSLTPLQEYLSTYDELLPLIRLNENDFIRDYTAEEHTIEESKEEIIKHLKAKKVVAERIPPYLAVGNFVVNSQSFGSLMAKKEDNLAKLIMGSISKQNRKRAISICEEFNKISRVLAKEPQTPEKLFELYSFIANIGESVQNLTQQIEGMRQCYAVLESFQFALTDDESCHKWQAIGWPRRLALTISATKKQLGLIEKELYARLQKQQDVFSTRVEKLQRVVATFSKYTQSNQADKVVADVKRNNIEIRQCIEEARAINSDQRLFGDRLTDYRSVFELDKEFKPYSDLWLTTYTWQESYRRWHTDAFETLDPDEIEHTTATAYKTLTSLTKVFRDKAGTLRMVEEMRALVERFKPWVPVVVALIHPGMKERHWEGLSEKLNMKLKPGDTINVMEDCLPLLAHKDVVVSHCEVAAKELQIEKALKDMRAKWESKSFVVDPYKDTGSFVLKDTQEVIELLDEHLNLTQQLQFSPFKEYFKESITDWERSLNLISDVLEQWVECQRAWRYLEPIFSSDDIAVQLPRLSKLFEKVDKTWRRIMNATHNQTNVLEVCLGTNKLLDNLRESNRILEEVQRGLNEYLSEKRQSFPRFYFLSDEELLEILSQSKEVRRIDNNIAKLFEFICRLEWNAEDEVIGFFSSDDEHIPAVAPVKTEGNVENWLKSIESMMKKAVHHQLECSFLDYPKKRRSQWVLTWPIQAVIAISQVYWTQGCEQALTHTGSVDKLYHVLDKHLYELVDVVQSPLTPVQRINMGALITIEVHAKDTVEGMLEKGVSSIASFDWVKQLRFYFNLTDRFCHIKQVDAHFIYGGEYLGNTGRLVVTPLTDRIYLTLTGALALCLGGAPAGPAGTGKTETTKDLAKALAKQCVVFNCQEGMTYLSMGKFFKGLAWTGAWACFDEFNRIDVEVLSVIAQQVTDLQQACLTKQYRIIFEESDIEVDPTHAIFITMNPGYAGRTELPDNLKVLFRPVACMVPDYAMIGEIRLFSYGYKKARILAQKMVMTFKLSSEQLSSQDHYDFGMRAVNSVISAAGIKKRENPNSDEDVLLLSALRDSNVPKFLKGDIELFEGIISDLFPEVALPQTNYGAMVATLQKVVTEHMHLQAIPAFVEKCLQLYDITILRHGLMLVGPAGSGKSSVYRALQTTLSDCAVRQAKGEDLGPREFMKVYTHLCNPKSVTMDQLYGAYDENGEWRDGILCVLFRCAARYGDEGTLLGKHWVIFDGPVDALWIESMNTVLDDNKKLCLVSGEIIQMNRDMTMMFEVEDLAVASPATVSRCGMIYMDPTSCVPVSASIASWVASLPSYMASQAASLEALIMCYLPSLITFVHGELQEYVASTTSNLVFSFQKMMNGYIQSFEDAFKVPIGALAGAQSPAPQVNNQPQELLVEIVPRLFILSLVWSVGATCNEDARERFDQTLRAMAAEHNHTDYLPPASGERDNTVYDYCYQYQAALGALSHPPADDAVITPEWVHWQDMQPEFEVSRGTNFDDIIVPTIDNTRQNYILRHLLLQKANVAVIGPTGTGKSVSALKMVLGGELPNTFLGLTFTFSAQTKAGALQGSLMAKFDKRRSRVYGAPTGKHFLVFIDDANLPQPERYGTQPPLELLRQLLGHGGFYSLVGGIRWNTIIDTSLILAMGPPGGGRAHVSNRFMRFFNYLSFPDMSETSKRLILSTILFSGFAHQGVDGSIQELGSNIVESTLRVFKQCSKIFLPIPAHVHYSFNMRDVMRVFPMLYSSDERTVKSREELLRKWIHEMQRVFSDRLINDEDKDKFTQILTNEMREMGFTEDYEDFIGAKRLIFGNFMGTHRGYEQITDMYALTRRFDELLATYNEENENRMDLVLFLDAIEHVCRIFRVLCMPNGHCLLLGIGGSGRKSLTRLACYLIPEMEISTVEITKNFGANEWHENLAKLLLECGKNDKKRTFLFSDTQIVHPVFLEDVAALLTSGDVPNLFEDQDLELINEKFRGICISENLPTTKVSIYARFVKAVRANLHVVLAFSPIGDVFRTRMRMFPSLIACCTIDWFAEWPAEALLSVARAHLAHSIQPGEEKKPRRRSSIAENVPKGVSDATECFKMFHLLAEEVTEQFFVETRRRSYVTPTSYLSFLGGFSDILQKRQRNLHEQRSRLENGLEKLRNTEERVAELEAQLKAQQPLLEIKKEEVRVMMERLTVDRREAALKEAEARKEEAAASVKAEECAKMRRECANRLAEAEPALAEAVKVLSKIKASEIAELNKYQSPPKGVQYVMEAVAVLLTLGNCPKEYYTGAAGSKKTPDWWMCAKSYMKDANRLLDTLVQPPEKGGFNREAMDTPLIEKIKVYCDNEEFQPEKVRSVSLPCMAMCLWVRAMFRWFFVNREIQPLRKKLEASEAELARVTRALHHTRSVLDHVIAAVEALEKEYSDAIVTQTELENEVEQTSLKLQRAARLIDGLGGEKIRWVELVARYNEEEKYIIGDVLISTATVSYCGPLTGLYRNQLLAKWKETLRAHNVHISEGCSLVSTLGDPVQIQEWQLNGLPSDSLSTENAIIMANSRNWPLLIDPQGQGNTWIRNIYKNSNLQVCKASNNRFMKTIEQAIRLGLPCLLENVGESLDAALEPVLLKNVFLIGSTPHVRIGDSAIPYDSNFRLYMTTKLSNPTYTPETIVSVSLLNFFITSNGLEEQLLAKTVGIERSDLEQDKQKLTIDSANKQKELKEIQGNILRLLEEAEGDILEQEELINTLERSKTKSTEINEYLQKSKETARIIDETRNKYRPHAERGVLLFFCVSKLSTIDSMCQFSLQWFFNLFLRAVKDAKPAEDVEQRVANLMDYFMYSFYYNVCHSLFEKHKLTFSFYLCTAVQQQRGELNEEEFRYFLRGPTRRIDSTPNPDPGWITDSIWSEVQFISSQLPFFKGFDTHVTQNIAHYKELFDSTDIDFQNFTLAAAYANTESLLQRLIVFRCFSKDKMIPAIQQYVKHYIGERYIIVPPFDVADAYKDSDCLSPLIFINSPGSDPMNDLMRFAESMRMLRRLDKVSLGQGQSRKAEEYITTGRERGQWVLLQNCHLAISWMPTLETIVESFTADTVNKEFRLWLTSMPCEAFPVAVLQISVKMTNEPPMGLRANVSRSYYAFSDTDLDVTHDPASYKKLAFSLCLFHGVIQERRKFGSLGFNIAYEFNDSDRNVCLMQLQKFIDLYDTIPFDVLTFLTGEINYGGRVTDDWDRRCMMTLIRHYLSPEVLQVGYTFSPSGVYRTLEPGTRAHYLEHLTTWPHNPKPEIFGLHDNADITCAQNITSGILSTVLSLISQTAAPGKAGSKDEQLRDMAESIQKQLPDPFDEEAVTAKYPTRYEDSMNIVLVQEIMRYNRLIRFIHSNLAEFLKAIRGEVLISAELEAVGSNFFLNSVPAAWASLAYPSLKPLSSWVDDLVHRIQFIQTWYDNGAPSAYWIGGFFFPQAFLTGTLQNYARRLQKAIDTISFDFKILDSTASELDRLKRPEKGALVYGLFMEGARWDARRQTLQESRPRELYTEMPVIHFDPVVNWVHDPTKFVCPVYKTLTRAGTLSTTGHSTNFVLPIHIPTETDPLHWVERGVACVVSLNF
ncbi:unnamed protein product [Phytomonas sp. EM1]|nr:unnamed protein product [Phytomonas sp. EM1]|eukprot:CCW62408.1 unnamed protein product [Phytomonas sp. isolate EM1]